MFENEAEEIVNKKLCEKIMCYGHCSFSSPKHHRCGDWHKCYEIAKESAEFGYNKANEENEGKCKTAYIKGIRTMANALKDYDRTDGAWTDYFEHTVEEVLKRLLQEK